MKKTPLKKKPVKKKTLLKGVPKKGPARKASKQSTSKKVSLKKLPGRPISIKQAKDKLLGRKVKPKTPAQMQAEAPAKPEVSFRQHVNEHSKASTEMSMPPAQHPSVGFRARVTELQKATPAPLPAEALVNWEDQGQVKLGTYGKAKVWRFCRVLSQGSDKKKYHLRTGHEGPPRGQVLGDFETAEEVDAAVKDYAKRIEVMDKESAASIQQTA